MPGKSVKMSKCMCLLTSTYMCYNNTVASYWQVYSIIVFRAFQKSASCCLQGQGVEQKSGETFTRIVLRIAICLYVPYCIAVRSGVRYYVLVPTAANRG